MYYHSTQLITSFPVQSNPVQSNSAQFVPVQCQSDPSMSSEQDKKASRHKQARSQAQNAKELGNIREENSACPIHPFSVRTPFCWRQQHTCPDFCLFPQLPSER